MDVPQLKYWYQNYYCDLIQVWSEHWTLASNENFERMRMKLIPHPSFDPHLEASAQRDNVQIADKVDSKNPLFKLSLSKDAVRR